MRRAPPTAAPARHICSGVCHGTLGELWQGPIVQDGQVQIALISLPVRHYSWMHFDPGIAGDADIDLAMKDKCRRAIALYLQAHRRTLPAGRWTCESELLQGKGMASSTADMVAAIRCLDAIFGIESSAVFIADLLRKVERSDSVFLDRYALYLSARQEVVHHFDCNPRLHACYIDEGNTVDTEYVGPALLAHYQRCLPAYIDNLTRAIAAFRGGDLATIAQCATTSAQLGQAVVPKRHLDALLAHQARFGADGIVVAHTGSLIGYLFIDRPTPARMGALSSFFLGLGHQCRFAQTGF